ncbi:hypothetical protein AB0H43_13990 [Hamadaea sp. NPDC050747]|uniref:hypothetical protein n=1 Tax=Hamadaea sp. NPDC050747 TaxID=3155789 RepID=UPI0033C9CB04
MPATGRRPGSCQPVSEQSAKPWQRNTRTRVRAPTTTPFLNIMGALVNHRWRQVADPVLLILAIVIAVLRGIQHVWDRAVIAAAAAAVLLWYEQAWLRPGLWSWLNGRGWHWIDETTPQP